MALAQIFLAAVQREIIREIPDQRVLPYGGPFANIVPDRDRTHLELKEVDRQTTTAANLVAHGATNVRATRQQNTLVADRAVQMIRHEEVNQEDIVYLDSVKDSLSNRNVRDRLRNWAGAIQTRNLEGLRITRGYLIASMIVGEIDWDKLGFQYGSTTFEMPSEMKLTPTEYWRAANGTPNADATPIANMVALDRQVNSVWGMPKFNVVGMSYDAYLAMIQSTEYVTMARAITAFALTSSLPIAGTEQAQALAEQVIGKRIRIIDEYFETESAVAVRTSHRYVPERLAVLWRAEDEGKDMRWEFGNVPLTKAGIASLLSSNAFGGDMGRGPLGWGGGDLIEYTHAALYAAQEGMPRRMNRGVSAVIETRDPS